MNPIEALLRAFIPSATYNVTPAPGTASAPIPGRPSGIPSAVQSKPTPGMLTPKNTVPQKPMNPKDAGFDYLGDWKPPFLVSPASLQKVGQQ